MLKNLFFKKINAHEFSAIWNGIELELHILVLLQVGIPQVPLVLWFPKLGALGFLGPGSTFAFALEDSLHPYRSSPGDHFSGFPFSRTSVMAAAPWDLLYDMDHSV